MKPVQGVIRSAVVAAAAAIAVALGASANATDHASPVSAPASAGPTLPAAPAALARAEVLTAPVLSPGPGFFTGPVTVAISLPEGAIVRYTLDGTDPTTSSAIYTSALPFVNRTGQTPSGALVATTPGGPYPWSAPSGSLYMGTVLRAAAFYSAEARSSIETGSYYVDPSAARYAGIPVFSLVSPPDNLFSSSPNSVTGGIYVAGPNPGGWPYYNANFFQDWERPVHVEYFGPDHQLAFAQDAGIQAKGGFSLANPIKRIDLYARSTYGPKKFYYPLFDGSALASYDKIALRPSGGDFDQAYMRTDLLSMLAHPSDIGVAATRPVVVFINGEYWGVHWLRERLNEDWVADHVGYDPSLMDMVDYAGPDRERWGLTRTVVTGSAFGYDALTQFIESHDLAVPANYDYVKTQVDVDNYAQMVAFEVYADNRDWPYNNVRWWRSTAPLTGWRWMMTDLDYGLGLNGNSATGEYSDMLWAATGDDLTHGFVNWGGTASSMLKGMLANQDFRNTLFQCTAEQTSYNFAPARVNALIDQIAGQIGPLMSEHVDRWHYPSSFSAWQGQVQGLRNWVNIRADGNNGNYNFHYALGPRGSLSLGVSDRAQGHLRTPCMDLGEVMTSTNSWTGTYWTHLPVRVSAVPNPGFRFVGWIGSDLTSSSIVITPANQATASLVAVFEPDSEPWKLTNGAYTLTQWLSSTLPGTFPPSMRFEQLVGVAVDPDLAVDTNALWNLPYSLTSRSRINGLDDLGVGFINTDNPQFDGGYVGSAALALDTRFMRVVTVTWTGGTILANTIPYAIRLQYRVGPTGLFTDVLDAGGQPVEYLRNAVSGDSQSMGPTALPAATHNNPRVELRWRYYCQSSCGGSGKRAQLRLDDVDVSGDGGPPTHFVTFPLIQIPN